MNSKRAKEIVASPVMVNVTYNNSPVYLENVNDNSQSCTVHYLNSPDKKDTVPLTSLVEH